MTGSLVVSPEVLASCNGSGVGLVMMLAGFRSLARSEARTFEKQAFIASTPARDAGLVRRHPGAYELRFALASELCARLLKLAEAAGHTGVFGFEFYPLGRLHPLNKTDNLVQAGLTRTPLQWRRVLDPEPY
jgi:hypothetical protein